MKTVKVELSAELETIEIYTFADWHIGDSNCDMKAIQEEITKVKNKENAYVICNGDLMNNATKSSVSDSYAEEITPMEQIQRLTELLDPIKSKILMMLQGNHEARTYRTEGVDLTYIVAKQLGLSERYCREGGVLFLRFGSPIKNHGDKNRKTCVSIYATHGSGGGKKEGGKANRLADLSSIVDCDIYIHSHTHLPMIIKNSFYRVNTANSSIAKVEKLFVNTAAKLDYGGYGQSYQFKPSSVSNPIIIIDGRKKRFTASL